MEQLRSTVLGKTSLLNVLDTLVAAAIGFIITYLFTHHSGIGVSPDSIAYVSSARNVLHSGQLMDYTAHPLVDFPAGFPLLLAAGLGLTKIDPLAFMPLLNPLMFSVLVALCGYMADRMGYPSRWYKSLLLLCIALSPALIEVYIMLWSETLFIILSVVFMIALRRYLYRHSMSMLLTVACICAVTCTIRYAGITLIATGGILLLLEKYPSLAEKIKHLFVFGLVSISLLTVNLIRNYHLTRTLTGMRQKGVTPLLRNIYYYGNTFTGWFFYGTTHYHLCLIIGLVLITLLVIYFTRGVPALLKEYPSFVRIALTFALLYTIFIVLSATLSRFEQINSRLLSPLYIPLVFGLAYPLSLFTRKATLRSSRRWWRIAAVGFFLLIISSQLVADNQWRSDIDDDGIGGYTEDMWSDSPLVQFLQSKPSPFRTGYIIYSNSPEGVYYFCGRHCQLLPQKAFPAPISEYYAAPHQYLIMFNDGDNDAILTLPDILAHKQMTLLHQFTDGAVYITKD
jgi:hypothetical protein